jgi:hypothetical protein
MSMFCLQRPVFLGTVDGVNGHLCHMLATDLLPYVLLLFVLT